MPKPGRSLRDRALQLLAQREQSRVELRRKLLVFARADEAARSPVKVDTEQVDAEQVEAERLDTEPVDTEPNAGLRPVPPAADDDTESASPRVEAVLAWLDTHQFLSDARFAESRINARAGRYGNRRILQELKQHNVTLAADAVQTLRDTEYARALAVWERRYGAAPSSAAERGRQVRFLMARGFSPEIVALVLRAGRGATGAMSMEGGH